MVRDSTDFVRRKDLINLVEITPEEHENLTNVTVNHFVSPVYISPRI